MVLSRGPFDFLENWEINIPLSLLLYHTDLPSWEYYKTVLEQSPQNINWSFTEAIKKLFFIPLPALKILSSKAGEVDKILYLSILQQFRLRSKRFCHGTSEVVAFLLIQKSVQIADHPHIYWQPGWVSFEVRRTASLPGHAHLKASRCWS